LVFFFFLIYANCSDAHRRYIAVGLKHKVKIKLCFCWRLWNWRKVEV